MANKKNKRKVGRPKKGPKDKTVLKFNIGFPADEAETIKTVRRMLKLETFGMVDANDQDLIHILVRRLMRELRRKDFSMTGEYIIQKNNRTSVMR